MLKKIMAKATGKPWVLCPKCGTKFALLHPKSATFLVKGKPVTYRYVCPKCVKG